VVYGYASSLLLLPDAGLGVVMLSTLDFTNELIGRLARRALRLALGGRGEGPRPRPARRLPPPGVTLAAELAGTYRAEDGRLLELRASGLRLTLIDAGVPIEIRPIGQGRFVLDGRIFGEETAHPAPLLEVQGTTLGWQGGRWQRVDGPVAEPIPAELAPHLGTYGPAFMPVDLQWSGGGLLCLLEYFAPHRCEPLGDSRFLLHGGLYEREILELGLLDAEGRPAIRVGEMLLGKRVP
jgi:D-alanyl-D-alanine dipeptidase